jgi:hypothetical protein
MEKEIATSNNFKEYWNLNIVANKPIEWYLEHPEMENYTDLYSGERAFDRNSINEIMDFLKSNKVKDLTPLLMYFMAHAISMDISSEIDMEDKSFIGLLLLSEQTEAFCVFFKDESTKKKRALGELIYSVAHSFMGEDSWQEDLNEYRKDFNKSTKILDDTNRLFLENCFDRIENSCLLQI